MSGTWRGLAVAVTVVMLVLNFFQPMVALFPHRGAAWTAPWPMQVAQAGLSSAWVTYDDMERWVLFAILGFLFSRFVENYERTLNLINEIYRPWGDR